MALFYTLSISGKSPSFYLYTTPVIGLGPYYSPSYKIKEGKRGGEKIDGWHCLCPGKDKETTGLERERPYVHHVSDYMAANKRNTQNKREKETKNKKKM